jgi:uncharacterized lipoprotein YajG
MPNKKNISAFEWKGGNMKYPLFIILLVAIIITAGCVSGNKSAVITPTPTPTAQPIQSIQPILANDSVQLVQVITIPETTMY